MNLFNVLKKRMSDLGEGVELQAFYDALYVMKNDDSVVEIIENCNNNYFYVNFEASPSTNKYDVGKLIVSFDDESKVYEIVYVIHLSYVSANDAYLPKVMIERNELMKAFVFNKNK